MPTGRILGRYRSRRSCRRRKGSWFLPARARPGEDSFNRSVEGVRIDGLFDRARAARRQGLLPVPRHGVGRHRDDGVPARSGFRLRVLALSYPSMTGDRMSGRIGRPSRCRIAPSGRTGTRITHPKCRTFFPKSSRRFGQPGIRVLPPPTSPPARTTKGLTKETRWSICPPVGDDFERA